MIGWLFHLDCPVSDTRCLIPRCATIRNMQNASDVVFVNRALHVLCESACNACAHPHCPLNSPILWFTSTVLTGIGPAVLGETVNTISSNPKAVTTTWTNTNHTVIHLVALSKLSRSITVYTNFAFTSIVMYCLPCPCISLLVSRRQLDVEFLHDSVFRAFVP